MRDPKTEEHYGIWTARRQHQNPAKLHVVVDKKDGLHGLSTTTEITPITQQETRESVTTK